MNEGAIALKEAFMYYTNRVHSNEIFLEEEWSTGFFSYVLTAKQKSRIKNLAKSKNWELKNCNIITIKGSFIKHVLTARTSKDGSNSEECGLILSAAFSGKSEFAINNNYNEQSLFLNTKENIRIQGNSKSAIAAIDVKGDLSPVTAYDSTRAKVNAILER